MGNQKKDKRGDKSDRYAKQRKEAISRTKYIEQMSAKEIADMSVKKMTANLNFNIIKASYPEYYELNDIPVIVWKDKETNKVHCYNDLGNPKDLGRVYLEGHRITKKQFEAMAKERKRTPRPDN